MQTAYVPIWNKLPKNATISKFAFDFGHFMQPISINWNDQTTLWPNKWPNILIPPHARLKTKASGQTSGHCWLHECRLGREWQSYKYMYLKYIQWMYMHCNQLTIILTGLTYKTRQTNMIVEKYDLYPTWQC